MPERRSIYRRVKGFFYYLLEDPESKARTTFNVGMMMVVLLSIAEMVLEVDPDLTLAQQEFLLEVEDGFIMIFVVEYLLRWWVCSDFLPDFRHAFTRYTRRLHRNNWAAVFYYALRHALLPKLRWMMEPLSIVDLLAILPVFRPFRLLRVLRVLRVLKLFRYSRRLQFFVDIVRDRGYELVSLMVVGTVLWGMVALGFFVVERSHNHQIDDLWDAIYWAIITITTVGYGDITPATPMGRMVAVLGTLIGMWVVVFMTSIIVSALTERILYLREHRMDRQIERLSDHFIVCGLEELGQAVCRTLRSENRKFVAVDNDPEAVEHALREGWLAITGDVTEEDLWPRLGLTRARCVITTIPSDAVNVFLIMMVKEKNPHCFVVASGTTASSERRLLRVGANRVVSPYQIGGLQMANTALRPTALQFFDLALKREHIELEMDELPVPANSSFAGVALMETNIRREFDIIVVGIVHSDGQMHFNPRADTTLSVGDTLICLGHLDDLERLRRALAETI